MSAASAISASHEIVHQGEHMLPRLGLAVVLFAGGCSGTPNDVPDARVEPEPCPDPTSIWFDATYDGVRSQVCVPDLQTGVEIDGRPLAEPDYPPFVFYFGPLGDNPPPGTTMGVTAQNVELATGESGLVALDRTPSGPEAIHVFVTVIASPGSSALLTPTAGTWTVLEGGSYGEHYTFELRDVVFESWGGHDLTYHRILARGVLPVGPVDRDPPRSFLDAGPD